MPAKNSKHDINELAVKVLDGLNRALRKLAENAAANDEELIIGDKDGNIRSVPAKELLKTLPKR
jgi:hypothetical protein